MAWLTLPVKIRAFQYLAQSPYWIPTLERASRTCQLSTQPHLAINMDHLRVS